MDYSITLSQLFNIKEEYAKNVIALLDEGNTIPFIARRVQRKARLSAGA